MWADELPKARNLGVAVLFTLALNWLTSAAALADNKWGADYFPNVTVTTQDGKAVKFYDDLLKGKSVAVMTMYTTCNNECPLETARMAQVAKILGDRMGRDIHFISISIDPERDEPLILKAYAQTFKTGPGWTFITGAPEDIKLIVRKLGLVRGSDARNKDGHQPSLMIGNEPTGQWMRNSAIDNPQFLATTMKNFLGWRDDVPTGERNYAEAKTLADMDMKKYLFQSRCAACHTIGAGDKIGPDLLGVTQRRGRDWVIRYLREPDRVRAEGDPVAVALAQKYKVRMPNQLMIRPEVEAVLAYLEEHSGAAPGAGHDHAAHDHSAHEHVAHEQK
jgi:protein SCO1/2